MEYISFSLNRHNLLDPSNFTFVAHANLNPFPDANSHGTLDLSLAQK